MIVLPAIDLMAGAAVRLRQGDPARRTTVGDDPVALARRWAGEGAEWLHVVDLDGAMAGAPAHVDVLQRICRAVSVPVQVGGGLRTLDDVRMIFGAGAARAVLGTAAVAGTLLRPAIEAFGNRIAVAIDVHDGQVATDGWQRTVAMTARDVAARLARDGVARFIYTDVRRDGMLTGPNLDGLRELIGALRVPVVLSGGVSSVDDVRLAAAAGAEGVIIGRALYEDRLSLAAALAAARGSA